MFNNSSSILSRYLQAGEVKLHYLSAGAGTPLILLHGWPTSAYLWRKVMEPLATKRWVIAPDLPGFGASDKPADVIYSVNYHVQVLDAFFEALGIRQLELVVHDLGGPIGLLWAVRNPQKVRRLVILNTIIYPDVSIWVKLYLLAARLPGIKEWLVSPAGIAALMRLGVTNQAGLTQEVIAAYQSPFTAAESRRVLCKTLIDPRPGSLKEVAAGLPKLDIPIRVIYGQKDFVIPAVASDLHRLKAERPDIQLTALPQCGHFLQEDQGERLSTLLLDFLREQS